MKLPYDAIIFDFDGVLADSMDIKTQAFKQMFAPFGTKIVEKVVEHHLKFGGLSRFEKFKYYYENFIDLPLSEEDMDELSKVFTELVLQKSIDAPWIVGAKEFLDSNYEDNDFFILSGTPQKELEILIKARNMEKYFKEVIGTPPEKPKSIKSIVERNYYEPPQTLYIGDSYSDWVDARTANINFLGLTKEEIFPKGVKTIKDFSNGIDC